MEKKKFDYEALKREAAEHLKKGGIVLGVFSSLQFRTMPPPIPIHVDHHFRRS